jgi:hypothetical protein
MEENVDEAKRIEVPEGRRRSLKRILLIHFNHLLMENKGGFSKQLHYLCKIFEEFNYKIFNLIFNFNLSYDLRKSSSYSYDEMVQLYIDCGHTTGFIQNDILKNITYLPIPDYVNVEDTNKLIDQYSIDTVFYLGDMFAIKSNGKHRLKSQFKVPSYGWFTCHHYPIVKLDYDGLRCFTNIICLTPSIKLILEKEFPEKGISYLPHITEKMISTLSKSEVRDNMNIANDTFVILLISNIYYDNRKAIDVHLIAFKQFNKKFPNSLLYVRAKNYIDMYKQNLLDTLQLPSESIVWNETHVTEEKLAELYTMSDAFLNCSKSEGFGVPILEAQQYNTNVITSDFLSMAEHNFQNNVTDISTKNINYHLNGQWTLPSSENICNKLEELYINRNNTTKVKRANWITRELTSYNNVKQNLYKILNSNKIK